MSFTLPWLGALELRDPWLLALVLCLPFALRVRGRASLAFAPYPLLAQEGARPARTARLRWAFLPRALDALGLCACTLALARPVERIALPLEQEGIDILLCLDRSSSMTATDLDGARSRMQVAKEAARRFIEGRAGDRVGLIGFARYPDLVAPPTLDQQALVALLEAEVPVAADGPEDATGIGGAVARAAEVLAESEARSKVVVLLTDGEENVAGRHAPQEIGPARAAGLARALGVRVYTIVAGRGRRGPRGEWIALDTRAVEALARQSGGASFAADDAQAVGRVFAAIDALEKTAFADPRYRDEERYLPFAVLACLAWLAARLGARTLYEAWP